MTAFPASPTLPDRVTAAAGPLSRLVQAVPADMWDRPSPCEGWSAGDVVTHIVDSQQDFLRDRGFGEPATDPAGRAGAVARRWADHERRLLDLVARPEVTEAAFDGFFGPTTVGATLLRFYVPDMLVHRWDVATAVGADSRWSEAEMSDLEDSIASWGDALYMEGICRSGVTAPPGADRQTVLLARMGRRVR